MNPSAILITVIYINGIRQNGCHFIIISSFSLLIAVCTSYLCSFLSNIKKKCLYIYIYIYILFVDLLLLFL